MVTSQLFTVKSQFWNKLLYILLGAEQFCLVYDLCLEYDLCAMGKMGLPQNEACHSMLPLLTVMDLLPQAMICLCFLQGPRFVFMECVEDA